MIRTLPAESALAYEIHGEVAKWGPVNYQLATLTDLMGRKWAGRRWKPIPRPESKLKRKPERPQMPVEEKLRRLARLQERHAARVAKAVSDG